MLHGDEGLIGVDRLHEAIHTALAARGVAGGRARPFWPHMTLLRDRREAAEVVIDPVEWTVREFVLIRSAYGAARHDIFGRWSLAA